MFKNITTIRVRYADTDQMQFVYNGKYLEYFEVGRTELLREAGLAYKKLEDSGYQLPLIEAGIKYVKPAYYDDLLNIESCVKKLRSAKVHIDYHIYRHKTDQLITKGFTDHMFIKTGTKKPCRPPKIYIDTLKKYFEKH